MEKTAKAKPKAALTVDELLAEEEDPSKTGGILHFAFNFCYRCCFIECYRFFFSSRPWWSIVVVDNDWYNNFFYQPFEINEIDGV